LAASLGARPAEAVENGYVQILPIMVGKNSDIHENAEKMEPGQCPGMAPAKPG